MFHDVPRSNQELFLKGVILIYIFLPLRINLIKNAINKYSLYFCVEDDKKIKTGKKFDVLATFKLWREGRGAFFFRGGINLGWLKIICSLRACKVKV